MRTTSRTTENVPMLQAPVAIYEPAGTVGLVPLCTPMPAEFGTPRQRAVTVRIPRLAR